MSITYSKDTTNRMNPNATLRMCDACGEHAPRFVTGVGINTQRLCPLCAVAADLYAMHPISAERLQEALITWITTPNPWLDCDDETFYAQMDRGRSWTQHDIDQEAERRARKAWVASVTAPETPADRNAAFARDFWTALIGGEAA